MNRSAAGKRPDWVNPGLLARDHRMELLARAADEVGRKGGIRGLWVLVPANDQTSLPTLNQKRHTRHQFLPTCAANRSVDHQSAPFI